MLHLKGTMQIFSSDIVDALLFDLGGVIIEIDFKRTFSHWATVSKTPLETIQAKFSQDSFYEQHERGEISISEYFASLRQSLGIDMTDAQFLKGWNALLIREIPGIAALLRKAKKLRPIYALTNTNVTHQQMCFDQFSGVLELFSIIFASSEMGKRKPEPAIFHAVADAIGIPLERIVFFDDSLENVEGARAVGLRTTHVRSLIDVETSLQEILG